MNIVDILNIRISEDIFKKDIYNIYCDYTIYLPAKKSIFNREVSKYQVCSIEDVNLIIARI